jgi:hypothetical protein
LIKYVITWSFFSPDIYVFQIKVVNIENFEDRSQERIGNTHKKNIFSKSTLFVKVVVIFEESIDQDWDGNCVDELGNDCFGCKGRLLIRMSDI